MSESMLRRILRDHQARRRSIALILCLSMVVSLGVFSGLRKDAVAKTYTRVVLECPYMADDAAQVVHTHNDDCYDEVGNLVCTLPELEAHTHGDECYTEVRTLVCGLEENPGHVHTDACYTAETTLVCGLEEKEGHQHTGDCYTLERGELLCDNTDEEHEHTDDCFAWNEVLSCGMEAGEGAHVHSDDCFRTEWILTCGMEEGEGAHTHTDDCYLTDRVLTCDKPEIVLHTHSDDCYQKNDDGSIYVDEDGYARLICGQPEIIEHVHDADCFKVYELDDGEPEETAAGEEIITVDETAGEQAEAEGTNETEPTITEAENTDEAEDTEEKTDSKDTAELNENEENKEETKDETKEENESTDTETEVPAVPMPAQSFEKTAGGIRVSVEAPEGAFPENTRMSVRPVNGSGLVDTVSDAVNGEILEVQAVDITFYDADDNEIEPATAIRVSIVPANSQYSEEKANVVHIDSEGAATAVEQAEGTTKDNSEVIFDVDSFSIYAIVYTVHFEYEVDGQVYTSEVPGAQDMLLSEVLSSLNIVAEEELETFLTKISDVAVSDPDVIQLTPVEGDWSIRPLKNSEEPESLTVTMQDGAAFRITVETEGITEVRSEDETAVIRTVNDLYLPQDATAVAQTLTEEESGSAIAAVQQAAGPDPEEVLENADDAVAAVDTVDTADTGTNYHAFSIGLENVDVESYDGFNVSVTLPEDAVVGRDFQLYQVKEDGTAADITESLAVTSQTTEDGLQAVSELSFTTDSFAEYVLSYSIETYYTTYEGDSLKISLNYGPKAGIPEGAELKVSEILPEDERYSDYLNDSVTELGVKSGAVSFARFLDIEIQKDGEKIEPQAPVSVKIEMMDLPEETGNAQAQVVHFGEQTEVLAAEATGTDVSFETVSFSVYGVLYTVDFEYSVNGKMYQFSLPGGGFVSFTDLVEVLGISGGTNSEENEDKNDSEIAENAEENGINEGAEENGINADTNTVLTLGNVEVSETTRKFVADVASVEFSSPELVDVSKVESESTVGQIKDNRGLECEYSAELTEEQIAEINAQTVEAGDWALISVQPFTSEEEITVTLKDGEVLSIRVTDAQIKKTVIDAKGDTWEITVTYGEDAQIPDGAELKVREMLPEDRKYEEYYQQSLKKTREGIDTEVSSDDFGYAHIFDIEILDQGQKIEPEANVSVTIKLLDTPQEIAALRVVHFSTEGPEIIDIEENKEKGGETELRFVTDEFSVYAVIEDVDHGEPDLAKRKGKISVGGYYLTNQNNYNENPWKIRKTNNFNQAAEYQFEATGMPGVYKVYTMVNGQKNYMHINHHSGNPHSDDENSACVNLTGQEYTMDLHVVQNTDGTYGIFQNNGGANYYLNQYGGEGGTGFAAYADADGGGNSKLTFTSVPADPNALKAGTHIMLAKIDEYYYIVNNDGTLTSVEYIEATNQVKVENPMMWTYTGTNLYHNSDAVDFDGSMIASDYYYKYIDPSSETGISLDSSDNTRQEIAGWKDTDNNGSNETPYYRIVSGSRQMQPQSALTYTNRHLKSSNGEYYIGVTEENGVLKLAGTQDSSHAVEILFASPTEVLPVDSGNHTVSHIDISIEGTSEVDVPLAYGKYYDADGNEILEVSSNKSITLTKEGIGISTDDMKKATIVAYTKNASGQAVPLDNAFYITGYSANAATEYSTPQVRIEGSFKVANLPVTDQDWGHRLNNKIYYSVTAVKTVTFDLIDPELGQLYDADGKKLTITIDVAFSASFDYWDNRNECPPVKWDPVSWPQGNIPGGSGMDFVLGGDAEQAGSNIVAIEITKLVVDENGNRINPSTSTPVNNSFEIWQDADGNPNSVIGMGIDGAPINVNYADYTNLHSKNIKVGVDGIGLVYDYDVTPGMYYIREDPNSVRDDIVDTDGNYWEYAGTRIETESPWRDDSVNDGKYHVSGIYTKDGGTYNAVPEVLGNYSDINGNTTWIDHDDGDKVKPVRNGFLEFYVYNIYKPVQTDITLKKVDKANLNDSDPDLLKGASFTVSKYLNESYQGMDTTWGTSGSMTVSDDKNQDGTYTLNGTFVFQGLQEGYYQIEETRFPDGYIKVSGNPRFKVEENASHELVVALINNPDDLLRLADNTLTIIVGNTPGAALPNTGGPGTRLFTILGSILTLGAGVLLWRRRRTI